MLQIVFFLQELLASIFKSLEGKRHDARIFVESGLQEQLQLQSLMSLKTLSSSSWLF